MASIMTSLQVADNMTAPLTGIMNALQMTVAQMYDMQAASSESFDPAPLDAINEIVRDVNAQLVQTAEAGNAAGDSLDASAAVQSYGQLENSAADTGEAIKRSTKSQQDLENAVRQTDSQAQKLEGTFSKLMNGLGVFTLVSKAINMVTGAIDGAISRYDTLNNFPKVMGNMGFSAETAEMSINRLSDGI